MKDDSPFVFAGLWEGWKDPANNEWLHTCTIITGEPNEFVREIHTRMPVILPEERHDAWLSGEAGKEILFPFLADRMKAWPISSGQGIQLLRHLYAGRRKSRIDATEARTLPFQNGMLPVGSANDMLLPARSVTASDRRRRGLQRPL
jgi:SOS response associated peptidase (SRAP)